MMKRCLFVVLFAFGCGSAEAPLSEAEADAGWTSTRETQTRKYEVTLELVPDPPQMGELFVVRATLRDRAGVPIEDAKVLLDARMPQHDHGMMTDPVDEPGVCDAAGACTHPGGVYETSGFKFHMGGEWTILVTVEGPNGLDNTSFLYEMR